MEVKNGINMDYYIERMKQLLFAQMEESNGGLKENLIEKMGLLTKIKTVIKSGIFMENNILKKSFIII